MWGLRFVKYRIPPLGGGQDEQPYLFWVIVDMLEKRMNKKEIKGESKHSLYDVELNW